MNGYWVKIQPISWTHNLDNGLWIFKYSISLFDGEKVVSNFKSSSQGTSPEKVKAKLMVSARLAGESYMERSKNHKHQFYV